MLDSIVRDEPMGFAALVAVIALLALAISLGIARYMQGRQERRRAIATLKSEWEHSDREHTDWNRNTR